MVYTCMTKDSLHLQDEYVSPKQKINTDSKQSFRTNWLHELTERGFRRFCYVKELYGIFRSVNDLFWFLS